MERGLGPEDIDSFPARVDALTLDQVNTAIKHYLDPSKMVTVEAGTLPDK